MLKFNTVPRGEFQNKTLKLPCKYMYLLAARNDRILCATVALSGRGWQCEWGGWVVVYTVTTLGI